MKIFYKTRATATGGRAGHTQLDDGTLIFASEIKALWAAGVPKTTNESQLLNYLTIGLVQNAVNNNNNRIEKRIDPYAKSFALCCQVRIKSSPEMDLIYARRRYSRSCCFIYSGLSSLPKIYCRAKTSRGG